MKNFIPKTKKGWALLALGICVPLAALAAAGDHIFTYKDDNDNVAYQTLQGPATGKALLLYDANEANGSRLKFVGLGGSISESGGVIDSWIPSWSTLDSRPAWTATFDGTFGSLQSIPGAFNPSSHNHPIGEITNLTTALAGKSDNGHQHLWAGIIGAVSGARGSISVTTTGSGAASYNSSTGVINIPTYSPTAQSINNAPGRVMVSATNATGYQVSATRNALVCYEGTFQTTSTIGGPSSVTVFFETADTNSTTPGDWTTIARQTNSNTITLAVVLQQVDIEPWGFCRTVAAGKYARIRYGSITGTATASINTEQQETLQ